MSHTVPVTPSSVYLNGAVIDALNTNAWSLDPVARIVLDDGHGGVTLGVVLSAQGKTGAGLVDCADADEARDTARAMGCTHYREAPLACNPFGDPRPLGA